MKRAMLALCAMCLFLTGCGTKLITLTEEEEDQIVSYASLALLKYNYHAAKGITNAKPEVPEKPEDDEEEEEEQDLEESGDASAAAVTEEDTAIPTVAFDEALDLSGCALTYDKGEFATEYSEGNYFTMSPTGAGNIYLVLNFVLSNDTKKDAEVDVLSQMPSFSVDMGETNADSVSTVLSADLSNIKETIKAGESKNVVVLFEVPDGTGDVPKSMTVTVDGRQGTMEL